MYEPSELERGHFTDKDQEIRITDLPEQFLQRTYPVMAREAAELEQEAKWIYQQAFVTRTISKQVDINLCVCVRVCVCNIRNVHPCMHVWVSFCLYLLMDDVLLLIILLHCIQPAKLFQQ